MHVCVFVHAARVENAYQSVQVEIQKLIVAAAMFEEEKLPRSAEVEEGVVLAMQGLSDRVQQLMAQCSVMLVTDALRDWQEALAEKPDKPEELTAVSATTQLHGRRLF